MSTRRINLGTPALIKFEGPDAARYLNGQLTQDVYCVDGASIAEPAYITDHKGRLQFHVWIFEHLGAFYVAGPEGAGEDLEARLTRYLIADDVEVTNLSGQWHLCHLLLLHTDSEKEYEYEHSKGFIYTEAQRYKMPAVDCWMPAGEELGALADIPVLEGDELEALRIERGVPAWGRELTEGMLPSEAGIDAKEISYTKGCYIGQEVISRIKSAGKVNRRLTRFRLADSIPTDGLELLDEKDKSGGEITSISPNAEGETRLALGYLKRGAEGLKLRDRGGNEHEVSVVEG